jgi:hypothetical protein
MVLNGSTSNEKRQEAEEYLKQQRNEHAQDYIQTMMECVQQHPEPDVRKFCVQEVRKNLSAFSEGTYTNKWNELSDNLKQVVKTNLFETLLTEQSEGIRHQLADAIGEVGGSVLSEEATKNQWNDLLPNIFKLINTGTTTNIESGLNIAATMLAYSIDEFLPVKQ